MKKLHMLLSLLLILCMFATLVPAAFAEDKTEPIFVEPPQNETIDGNVTVQDASMPAVLVLAEDGKATANITGDVTATGEDHAYGVVAAANDEGASATVTVGGNVTTNSTGDDNTYGVEAFASKGSSSATVSGDVAVTGTHATGIVGVSFGGETNAEVKGDVTVSASESGDGAYLMAQNGGTVNVTVSGNLEATGSKETVGAVISAGDNSSANLEVLGDAAGDGYGMVLNAGASDEDSKAGKIDVLVEGTVKGGESAIALGSVSAGTEDAITLTVWKAELNEEGKVVGTLTNDHSTDEAKEEAAKAAESVEKNILYIIKVETPEGGTVNLQGTVKSHDKDAAKEGETVTLNTLVQDGYKFIGIDSTVTLVQDANGNYSLVVPKGGGVFLKVKLQKAGGSGEVYTGPAIIGSRQLKGGAWLNLFADGTYVIVFPDGKTEKGTFAFKDGAPVFTSKAGKVCEPTKNDEGNFEYTYVRNDGKEFEFTLSKTFTARTIKAAEKV